jgi:hypothetical protein
VTTKKLSALLVTTTLVALTGCASSPVTLRETYAAPASAQSKDSGNRRSNRKHIAQDALKDGCSVRVMALQDSRTDPSLLGVVAGRPVHSPGQGAEWISGMLSGGLKEKGVTLSAEPGADATSSVLVTEARLVTAWVGSTATSMNGTVVIAVRHGAAAEEKIYRGAATVVNWSSGEGEIQSLMDRAFEQMLVKLGADLRDRCEQGIG